MSTIQLRNILLVSCILEKLSLMIVHTTLHAIRYLNLSVLYTLHSKTIVGFSETVVRYHAIGPPNQLT